MKLAPILAILLLVAFVPLTDAQSLRIVSLAPHLTEWVYSLDAQDNLVAVSERSDFPEAAKSLPRVADYNGANIAAIVAVEPDLILAWDGGNRPQDISRLQSLGYEVFLSSPNSPSDIAKEIRVFGQAIDKEEKANELANQYSQSLQAIHTRWQQSQPVSVFYYMWNSPLMTIGEEAWANKLLHYCRAHSIFADAPVDYPEVSLQEVLRRQPGYLVAATPTPFSQEQAFWNKHRAVLTAPLIQVDPDITSRFTLRLPNELASLCQQLHQHE